MQSQVIIFLINNIKLLLYLFLLEVSSFIYNYSPSHILVIPLQELYYIFENMRKRSGAIHSDSQEDYIKLAEQSLGRTGLFYDRQFNHSENLQNPEKYNKFSYEGFDHQVIDDLEREERAMNQSLSVNITSIINIAIICNKIQQIYPLMNPQCTKNQQRKTGIDLIVRKLRNSCNQQVILKYWVIEEEIVESPLTSIYISGANQVYEVASNAKPSKYIASSLHQLQQQLAILQKAAMQ